MPVFVKSNAADKEMQCEATYNRYIVDTCEFLCSCEEIAEILRIKLPTGCYTNFRDALFHFRRLVQSFEENELLRQSFAVAEHANRAKTDAIVCILEYCTYILQILSHEKFSLPESALNQLTSIKNEIVQKAVNLRLSGIMLDNASTLRISDQEFEKLLDSFFAFVNCDAIGRENFLFALEETKKGTNCDNESPK